MLPTYHAYGEQPSSAESALGAYPSVVKTPPKTRFGRDDLELVARRFVAWVVDYVVIIILCAVTFATLKATHAPISSDIKMQQRCLTEAVSLLYFVLLYNHPMQATLGMRLVRIKIFSEHHGIPTFRQALITYLVFSVCQYWMNRIAFIMFVLGLNPNTLIVDDIWLDQMLVWVVIFSKAAVFFSLYLMLIYTGGRQSLANYIGKTYIKATGAMAR
jgi:uncharacterized RDD family membrane protein YckC